jgi:hypothetical protein
MTSLPNDASQLHAVRIMIPRYHDVPVLPSCRQASSASERAACGRAVLTVSTVPTPTLVSVSAQAAAHVEPTCGCTMASSSNGKKKVGSFFLCILTGVPQASGFTRFSNADGLGDKPAYITTELHQLPVYREQ